MAPTAQTVIQACAEVLTGKQEYIRCGETGSARATFQAKVTEWYDYSFPTQTAFGRFSVTDLDADGLPELLLELEDTEGYPFGYELFRYEGGNVYGYPFVARRHGAGDPAGRSVCLQRSGRQRLVSGAVFRRSGAMDSDLPILRVTATIPR